MFECKLNSRDVTRSILLATFISILIGSLGCTEAAAYYSLIKEPRTRVTPPPVILQNGTAGTSTIYTNSTSAKVSVEAPSVYDFVDNNISNVDSNARTGTHLNFTAEKYGPDLIFDNLTEADNGAPINDSENFVDDNTSNVDGIDDKGTHSNFTAQQHYDSYFDTLTEQDTAGALIIRPNAVGTKTDWNPVGSTNNWECVDEVTADEDTTFVNTTSKVKKDFYNLQDHTTETGSISNVRLHVRAKGNAGAEIIPTLKIGGVEYPGQTRTLTTSYADYYHDWATNPASGDWTWSAIDAMEAGFRSSTSAAVEHRVTQLYLNVTYGPNYELDLEIRWTTADYDKTNEYLCINVGTTGDEDLQVDVWTGSWTNLLPDLNANSWNNVSVSSYLTSDTLVLRFLGGAESGDSSQDSWQIECSLLHVWNWEYNYNLDLETQWTDANYTRTYEELCIKTGTTDTEDIQVYVWNVTGSSWHLVFSDLAANAWNNISVSDYLTDSNFTIRFRGGNETGDATQSSWDIDASLLHVWTDIEDYVDNNTSDADASGDIGTHSNFTAQKYGPDLVNDTLTEEDVGVDPLELWVDGFTADEVLWTEVGTSPYLDAIDYPTNYIWADATDNEYEGKFNFANSSDLGTINDVKICLYAMNEPGENQEIEVYLYNSTGGPYSIVQFPPTAGSWNWHNYSCLSTLPSWTEVNNGQLRVRAEKILGGDNVYIDAALILVNYTGSNYVLDLEVQWINVDYTEANEELCIYGGIMASEDLLVDVWNTTTSTWNNVFTDLTANGWKNYSVTSWLTSSTITIRFRGGTESWDTTQSSWEIDAALLHVWTENYVYDYDYVLRVNNTVTDSWQIRLKRYADSNISRLQNCTIYFHNSSDGMSRQIYIQNGAYTNQTGPWYDLGALETIYIAMTVEANSTGTSYVYAYLEIRIPNTTTYAQYIITFTVT